MENRWPASGPGADEVTVLERVNIKEMFIVCINYICVKNECPVF